MWRGIGGRQGCGGQEGGRGRERRHERGKKETKERWKNEENNASSPAVRSPSGAAVRRAIEDQDREQNGSTTGKQQSKENQENAPAARNPSAAGRTGPAARSLAEGVLRSSPAVPLLLAAAVRIRIAEVPFRRCRTLEGVVEGLSEREMVNKVLKSAL
jgi:hypothetical protein